VSNLTIAIDAMGGDHGIKTTVPAVKSALANHPELNLILVGNEKVLKRALEKVKLDKHPRLSIQHASEVVEMDELPSRALRYKKDSSMRVAINLVKEGRAQACVSAGNTGALMATSRFVLKTLPGIDRPAIVYAIPGVNSQTGQRSVTHMLDLGANVDSSAENLFQFAIMASVRRSLIDNLANPRVALLNIGEEEMKGLEVIKEAAKLIDQCEALNYIGFVEGNDIFADKADVVVCDGFIGNVALKTAEGTAKFIGYMVKDAFKSNIITRISAILALPALLKIKKNLDMRRYNGASFLGLKGIVIKSHGGADALAFSTAITEAIAEVKKNIPEQIHAKVEALLSQIQQQSDQIPDES
jgi:glycerol-3-phosphate acyltransferase PlsX